MNEKLSNKHGVASALISSVFIVATFLPFIDIVFVEITAWKLFSLLAEEGRAAGFIFFTYFAIVVVNIIVQLISGNKFLSVMVGIMGVVFIATFSLHLQSQLNDKVGSEFDLEGLFDVVSYYGISLWGMLFSAISLIFVPMFFKENNPNAVVEIEEKVVTANDAVNGTVSDDDDEIANLKAQLAELEKKKLQREIERLKGEIEEKKYTPSSTLPEDKED